MNTTQNLGWQVNNGSGWNHHKTADALATMLAESPDQLPTIPLGYGVLVAPVSDKPLGLRCALVRVLPRLTETIDGKEYDNGPDESAGEVYAWAKENFGLDAEKVFSCIADQQDQDNSGYFTRRVSEMLTKVTQP